MSGCGAAASAGCLLSMACMCKVMMRTLMRLAAIMSQHSVCLFIQTISTTFSCHPFHHQHRAG